MDGRAGGRYHPRCGRTASRRTRRRRCRMQTHQPATDRFAACCCLTIGNSRLGASCQPCPSRRRSGTGRREQPNERTFLMPRIILSLLVGLVGLGSAWSQEPAVWVASPWQHVLRSSEPGGAKSAEVAAARNEYEPLRIIVRAGAQKMAQRAVGGQRPWPDEQRETSRRGNRLFREHYIDIFKPSRAPRRLTSTRMRRSRSRAAGSGQNPPAGECRSPAEPGFLGGSRRIPAPAKYSIVDRPTARRSPSSHVEGPRVLPFTLPRRDRHAEQLRRPRSGAHRQLGMDAGSRVAAVEDQYIDSTGRFPRRWKHRPKWTPEERHRRPAWRRAAADDPEDRHVNALCVLRPGEPEKCRAYLGDMAPICGNKGWLDLAYIYLEASPTTPSSTRRCTAGRADPRLGHQADVHGADRHLNPDWGTLYERYLVPIVVPVRRNNRRQRQKLGEEIWTCNTCQGGRRARSGRSTSPPVHFPRPFWDKLALRGQGFLYWSKSTRRWGRTRGWRTSAISTGARGCCLSRQRCPA